MVWGRLRAGFNLVFQQVAVEGVKHEQRGRHDTSYAYYVYKFTRFSIFAMASLTVSSMGHIYSSNFAEC